MSDGLNEEGLAYGYMFIAIYFGAAVLLWGCWSYATNIILDVGINPMIADGSLSLQTASGINYAVNFLRYAPVVLLIMGFIWGVRRAIAVRDGRV